MTGTLTDMVSAVMDERESALALNRRLSTERAELRAALAEMVRLDDEGGGLSADNGGELVSALHEARTVLAETA